VATTGADHRAVDLATTTLGTFLCNLHRTLLVVNVSESKCIAECGALLAVNGRTFTEPSAVAPGA
jgi:hypothetical protein